MAQPRCQGALLHSCPHSRAQAGPPHVRRFMRLPSAQRDMAPPTQCPAALSTPDTVRHSEYTMSCRSSHTHCPAALPTTTALPPFPHPFPRMRSCMACHGPAARLRTQTSNRSRSLETGRPTLSRQVSRRGRSRQSSSTAWSQSPFAAAETRPWVWHKGAGLSLREGGTIGVGKKGQSVQEVRAGCARRTDPLNPLQAQGFSEGAGPGLQ
eukprot:366276-Chlamydomonas_euryale.AAC.10